MAFDIPEDFQPDNAAPVAVTRRQGEGYDQLQARKQGYSDQQIGYSSSRSSRRSGFNPLEQSYRMSLAKEKEANDKSQDLARNSLAERSLALREKEAAAQDRIHAASQADKSTALDQMGYLLDEQDQLAQQYGRGSREYMLGALSVAKKYPAAIMADPRLGQQLNHYDTVLTNAGVPDETKQAVSEIGQIDPNGNGMLGYIDSIPGKYPGIVNDPHVMKLFDTKRKEAAAIDLQRQAKAAGLVQDRTTAAGPGGNVTLINPKPPSTKTVALSVEDAEAQNAKQVAQGAISFGILDAKGKLKPNVKGDATSGKATHVTSYYYDPKSKHRVLSDPIPIADFMALQQRAQQGAQGPSGGIGDVTQANDPRFDQTPYNSDIEVKAAYQSGNLTKDEAAEILRKQFGHR